MDALNGTSSEEAAVAEAEGGGVVDEEGFSSTTPSPTVFSGLSSTGSSEANAVISVSSPSSFSSVSANTFLGALLGCFLAVVFLLFAAGSSGVGEGSGDW